MIKAAISNVLPHGNRDFKTLVRKKFTCRHNRSSVSPAFTVNLSVKQCSQNSLKLYFQIINGTVSTSQSCNICAHTLVAKGKLRSEHCLYVIRHSEWFEQVSSIRGNAKLLQLPWLHLHITTSHNTSKLNKRQTTGKKSRNADGIKRKRQNL